MKIKIWNNQQSVIDTGQKREAGKIKNIYPVQSTGRIFRAGEEPGLQKNVREIMSELYALVGLFSVKKLIEEIYAFVEIQKLRCKEKLVTEPLVLHMIFKGNPGTGKTTVARILGKLFKEVGVLPRGHMIEVERADLVGEFIGHTAHKTREQVKKALGGILFIDEAYSLARGGEKDFGKEAIDALVKGMEDYRGNLILILAGYQDEMNWFIETNPGIRSRFPIHITFSDYRIDELLDIADLMLKQRQYVLSEEARKYLRFLIDKEHRRHEHSGNARLVRNLIERAMRRQAVRLIRQNHDLTRNELMMITGEDLERDIL